ncbi:nitroreductase family deazaflavin-dependent oxidoreductase [Granulicoccus phenolivorans]|uniref:nitroreductase family deazaflavin-dependent oxidoreductase n=1 Tax=Granulicoccus phenolivorans TaxID=266854 RepID=UPI0003F86AC6|nr:nitroreductase family deazaflavin-dependent oxidoreductase [Granulicoccus phenolivorans]
MRRRFLQLLKHSLNRATTRLARSGRGPFSLVRHVGRRSGKEYETPLRVAPAPGGFIVELTYGERVDWYRNIVAAGGCDLLVKGGWHRIVAVEPYPAEAGPRAFGFPAAWVLRLTRRTEYRLLRTA